MNTENKNNETFTIRESKQWYRDNPYIKNNNIYSALLDVGCWSDWIISSYDKYDESLNDSLETQKYAYIGLQTKKLFDLTGKRCYILTGSDSFFYTEALREEFLAMCQRVKKYKPKLSKRIKNYWLRKRNKSFIEEDIVVRVIVIFDESKSDEYNLSVANEWENLLKESENSFEIIYGNSDGNIPHFITVDGYRFKTEKPHPPITDDMLSNCIEASFSYFDKYGAELYENEFNKIWNRLINEESN